ncbi:MAG TPA: hypothetical protein VGM80_06820 [Gaiellaceae bacterium]|jgi:hypothetical protein
MTALLIAFALLVDPSVKPWPIGPGPRYTPPPAPASILAGNAAGGLLCRPDGPSFRVHVELFAGRRVVVVPAGIGVAGPVRRNGAEVVPGGCVYPVRTFAPGGVVEVDRGRSLTLADLFRVWGQKLGPRRLASFATTGTVRVYVDGRRVGGAPGDVLLTPHAEIVLELGPYVAPHSFFLFPGGGS